jgi:hypothetical protein
VAKKSSPVDDGNRAEAEESSALGKGRPTPTRKEAQAAKAQPLVGNRDRGAMKAQRAKQAEAREQARLGMMRGDERFLGPRDKGPQRRYVRDYVDARFNIGEWLIPFMVVILLAMFLPGPIQVVSVLVVWGFVILAVIDAIFLGFSLKRKLAEKFGADRVESGFRWYAAMRAFQFRMLRMPKPQVKRFQFPA